MLKRSVLTQHFEIQFCCASLQVYLHSVTNSESCWSWTDGSGLNNMKAIPSVSHGRADCVLMHSK